MERQQRQSFTLAAVSDVSPNRDDPPSVFRYCGDVFRKAGIVFGHLEAPLSDRGVAAFTPGGLSKLPTKNVLALAEQGAGFDVMSFACNHAMDYGHEAFYDTLDTLEKNNIAVVGAGRDIGEARRPVILEKNGTKVGFLGYLSIIFPGLLAQEDVPGCAPLRASTYYEQVIYAPGSPPRIVTRLFPEDKEAMEQDIRKLRDRVDVLVVSMHCGVHHVPAMVSMYQKEAAYAAIDAGADLVLQHHAHLLKGIEMYKGKAIFYCTGAFGFEQTLPFPGKRKPWTSATEEYRKMLRIKTIPGYEKHRYMHHEALKTMIVKAYIRDGGIRKVTYVPAYTTPDLEPEVLTRKDARAQEVFDYVKGISESEELNVRFAWDGDEVLVSE